MKILCCRAALALTFALTLVSGAVAETRYVSDSLVITVRELPEDASTRLKNIVTDTPFEALEESGDYLKIRLGDGTEGYVKKRYTTTDTPKPLLLKRMQTENARLEQQYSDLKASLSDQQSAGVSRQKELQKERDGLKKELAKQAAANKRLQAEFSALEKQHETLKKNADNVVQIVSQNENLHADNERLQIEFDSMQSENAMLLRTAVIKWVLTGAGILFIGWIMGKASRNKRRY